MSRKTRKSVSKRIKVSSKGKLLRSKPGHGHLLRNKSTKQRRKARNGDLGLAKGISARLRQCLPHA